MLVTKDMDVKKKMGDYLTLYLNANRNRNSVFITVLHFSRSSVFNKEHNSYPNMNMNISNLQMELYYLLLSINVIWCIFVILMLFGEIFFQMQGNQENK